MGKEFHDNNNRGGRGGRGDRGGRGGRGGFRPGGNRGNFDQGPPSFVIPYGTFVTQSQNNFLVKCTDTTRVPKFNRGVYLQNKSKVGSIDQILGPVANFYFSVKPADGIKPSSFKEGQLFHMNPEDLLPMDRFTNTSKGRPQGGKGKGGPGGRSGDRPFQRGGFQRGGFQRGGSRPQGGGFNRGRGGFNR